MTYLSSPSFALSLSKGAPCTALASTGSARTEIEVQLRNVTNQVVFCSAFTGTSYSVVRNLKISAGLIAVAFAFYKLLGLNLPLY